MLSAELEITFGAFLILLGFIVAGFFVLTLKLGLFSSLFVRYSSTPMFLKDSNLRLVIANDAYIKFIGEERYKECLGDSGTFYLVEEKVLNTGEPIVYDHSYDKVLDEEDNKRDVKVSLSKIKVLGSSYLLGEIMDSTEVSSLKRDVLEIEMHYKDLVEKIGESVVFVDKDLVIRLASAKVCSVLGTSESSIVGKDLAKLLKTSGSALLESLYKGETEFAYCISSMGKKKYLEVRFFLEEETGGWRVLCRDNTSKIAKRIFMRDQNKMLTLLGQLMVTLSQEEDVKKSFRDIIETVGVHSGASAIRVYEVYRNDIKLTQEWVEGLGLRYKNPEIVSVSVPGDGKGPSVSSCSKIKSLWVPQVSGLNLRYVISCPILVQGSLWGTMCFFTTEDRIWACNRLPVFDLLATGVGSIISLREEMERMKVANYHSMKALKLFAGLETRESENGAVQ